ncbi:OmpH family outer membrane protein, partial [bacterium]|nr:OmpH family outer membrane protein [bacterium]
MKKFTLIMISVLLVMCSANLLAQNVKIGYVNSDRILAEFEEAKEAQRKLDVEAKKLEDEYRGMLGKLDSLNRDFERQKMIMREYNYNDEAIADWYSAKEICYEE